jgi:hypothetical protein
MLMLVGANGDFFRMLVEALLTMATPWFAKELNELALTEAAVVAAEEVLAIARLGTESDEELSLTAVKNGDFWVARLETFNIM